MPIEGDGSESPVPVGEFGPLSDWKDCVLEPMDIPRVWEDLSLP